MNHPIYSRKSYWLKRVTRCERNVVDVLERARRHDKTLRPRHIGGICAQMEHLGAQGETLYHDAVEAGMSERFLGHIADTLDDIQDLSSALVPAAKKVLGLPLRSLRPYENLVARGSGVPNISVAKEKLDKLVTNEEDA